MQNGREWFATAPEFRAPGSPAAPGGEGACEELDVRGFVRRPGQCQRGALDHGATPDLSSALDGLWLDPSADGQYLQLAHFGRNRVLLTWLSFNALGDRVWAYAIGQPQGEKLTAVAYLNDGVRVIDGVLRGAVEAREWGSLSVSVASCQGLELTVAESGAPAATHALAPLTRSVAADCFDDVPYPPR